MYTMPQEITQIIHRLESAGYQGYLVGGAVRDLYLGQTPHDWDIATSATPEQLLSLFTNAHTTGAKYGTITVITPTVGPVEVTTFRREGPYTDRRRPDYVLFAQDLETDLARRDFTCNALAYHPAKGLIDPFDGTGDLSQGILRSVGDPTERIQEDSLRIMRAYRFQLVLNLKLDKGLASALCTHGPRLAELPPERIGAEMFKILHHPKAHMAIRRFQAGGILEYILPELTNCYHLEQNQYHAYSVYGHTLVAMKHIRPGLELKTSALLHDIGKAAVKEQIINGTRRFWGHQNSSADLARGLLTRWAWPAAVRNDVVRLVKEHMFYWPDAPTDRALNRFIAKIGPELILDLLELRRADVVALGPRGKTRLGPWNQLRSRIELLLQGDQAFSLKDLAVTGKTLITQLGIKEGPQIGALLQSLFDAVLAQEIPNETHALIAYAKKLELGDE